MADSFIEEEYMGDWREELLDKWVKENIPQGGVKHDQNKPPMELLDHEFLVRVSEVLGFGAKKYHAHNWRGGINYSRLIGAAYRHLGAYNSGEDRDPESGLSHLAHLGCCIMFLTWMDSHRPDLDDRYKPQETSNDF
jgi:hypothetical protein